MKELIEKIGSYHLFNYLVPGVVYIFALNEVKAINFEIDNLVIFAFISYFVGMVISRVGSVIVEPFLKWTGFIRFKDYKEFVEASKVDPKLEVLSEQNNTYRSIISMILLIAISIFYEWLGTQIQLIRDLNLWIILVLLLALFLPAYRKQTKYITKRIEKNLEN